MRSQPAIANRVLVMLLSRSLKQCLLGYFAEASGLASLARALPAI